MIQLSNGVKKKNNRYELLIVCILLHTASIDKCPIQAIRIGKESSKYNETILYIKWWFICLHFYHVRLKWINKWPIKKGIDVLLFTLNRCHLPPNFHSFSLSSDNLIPKHLCRYTLPLLICLYTLLPLQWLQENHYPLWNRNKVWFGHSLIHTKNKQAGHVTLL